MQLKLVDGRTLRVAGSIANPVPLKAVHQTHSRRSGSSAEVEPSELLHDLQWQLSQRAEASGSKWRLWPLPETETERAPNTMLQLAEQYNREGEMGTGGRDGPDHIALFQSSLAPSLSAQHDVRDERC